MINAQGAVPNCGVSSIASKAIEGMSYLMETT